LQLNLTMCMNTIYRQTSGLSCSLHKRTARGLHLGAALQPDLPRTRMAFMFSVAQMAQFALTIYGASTLALRHGRVLPTGRKSYLVSEAAAH